MAQALSRQAEVATVGLLASELFGRLEPTDDSIGLEHELVLWDRRPELWHRWHSWQRLRRFYLEKAAGDGRPDVLLVRDMHPVFNHFVRWLRRQHPRPRIVLVLADSGLGQPVSWSRRFRYLFKPMQTLEHEAVFWYDACLGFGLESRRHFEPRGVPWMWMPSAFNFLYHPPPPADPVPTGPVRFGYFGGLSQDIGMLSLVRAFLTSGVPGPLRICGFGGFADTLKKLAGEHSNLHFDGLLPRPEDCLPWAQQVDVLVNPRVPFKGRDNSFPSKIFEFGMTGKAILSTRTGGVDLVLGDEGLYLETENFEDALRRKLCEAAAMDRTELQRRGTAIRNRILKDFNWDAQARRLIEFLTGLVSATKPG
jgi:glycosyltransferase involved in cell wall biosynthesis